MMNRSIDLFAGIGGIRMGFKNAFGSDISTVFVSEWDTAAQKTYVANFKDDFQIAGDITKVKEKDIPSFDICLAGFPCQAFSIAGTGGYGRSGFDDSFKGMQIAVFDGQRVPYRRSLKCRPEGRLKVIRFF